MNQLQDARVWRLAFIVLVAFLAGLGTVCTLFGWPPLLSYAVGAVLGAAAMLCGVVYTVAEW